MLVTFKLGYNITMYLCINSSFKFFGSLNTNKRFSDMISLDFEDPHRDNLLKSFGPVRSQIRCLITSVPVARLSLWLNFTNINLC